jgi:hypothetical protein
MTTKTFKYGDNLRFIADYLFDNPGAGYTNITKALCEYKDTPWTRGHYCRYFTVPSNWCNATTYPDNLWYREATTGGWMLTLKGMGYVTPSSAR